MEYLKLTTPKGIARYPYLATPDTQFSALGDYKITLDVPAEAAKELLLTLRKLHADNVDSITQKTGKAPQITTTKQGVERPLPVDEITDKDGNAIVSFRFKMKPQYTTKTGDVVTQKPTLFDSKVQLMPVTTMVGDGSAVKVSFTAAAYLAPIGAGVSLRLQAVQILELVKKRSSATDSFEVVDDAFVAEVTEAPLNRPPEKISEEVAESSSGSEEQAQDATGF
jgi:hypothetical protein